MKNRITIKYLILSTALIYAINSCEKDKAEVLPAITTLPVVNITASEAQSGGDITNNGGSQIVSKGVVWSTEANPTLKLHTGITINESEEVTYTSTLISLSYNTTYYVRAYASNKTGTAYGNELVFSTLLDIPTVAYASMVSITPNSAICNSEIANDGGSPVTARGVCWNTSPNPTTNHNKTNDGVGIGLFSSSLSGLTDGGTYYLRAYATNTLGTAYGSEISFTASATIMDIDENIYNIVKIGDQFWTMQNLKTTKYNDGTQIVYPGTNSFDWQLNTTGAYAWYDNDISNKNTYGALYNWHSVNTGKLCPSGWHIPTDAEWTTLVTFLGGESIAGGKLKEEGTSHWISPNTDATNESRFLALPGGIRSYSSSFSGLGGRGFWWSSNDYDIAGAWYRVLYNNGKYIYRNYGSKNHGFSVRCVKD